MSSQHHTLAGSLPRSSLSRAYWSMSPGGSLIVFVHGFNGKSVKTWLDFPSLLQRACPSADLVFYGYDGLWTPPQNSALQFLAVFEELVRSPAEAANRCLTPALARSPRFAYSHIILAAHSMGAAVVRSALLTAVAKGAPWLDRTHIVLYAPAHLGANGAQLVAESLSGVAPVGALLKGMFPPLLHLQPNSAYIQNLVRETQVGLAAGALVLRAHTVVHGQIDSVVVPDRFCSDPTAKVIDNAGHSAVCKPSSASSDSILHLLSAL